MMDNRLTMPGQKRSGKRDLDVCISDRFREDMQVGRPRMSWHMHVLLAGQHHHLNVGDTIDHSSHCEAGEHLLIANC
jgi:hypothetical protein